MDDGRRPPADDEHDLDWYVDDLLRRGIRRVHVFAWRDLDDPDAGGSEVHADEFMRRWADRGLDVMHRTSAATGRAHVERRNGYEVIRRGSRYSVFPRAVVSEITRRMGQADAIVEIWNGVPWFSPIWCRRPKITMLHHVHGPMWDQILPGPLAAFGRTLETRLAPPFYRRGLTVTPSDATREELLEIGFRPDRVVAVPNGVDSFFSPGGEKTEVPSLVAVGRLAPVKRFDLVIDAAVEARRAAPDLRLSIIGEGPLRTELQQQIDRLGAGDWIAAVGARRPGVAGRPLSTRLAGGQRIARRGLGAEPDRGGSVWHPCGRNRYQRAPQQRGAGADRAARDGAAARRGVGRPAR